MSLLPHILLIHGGPGAAGSLHPMAEYLSKRYSVLECLQTRYSISELKQELITQIRTEANPPVILIGHSWGAWLSVMVAAEHPQIIRKLVLTGCPPFDDRYVPMITDNRLNRLDETARDRFRSLLSRLAHEATDETMTELKLLVEQTDNFHLQSSVPQTPADARMYEAIWPEAAAMRTEGKLKQLLTRLTCPVTVIHGEQDPHPLPGVTIPLDEAGVAYQLHLLPRCGHTPFLETYAAADFYALLDQILV